MDDAERFPAYKISSAMPAEVGGKLTSLVTIDGEIVVISIDIMEQYAPCQRFFGKSADGEDLLIFVDPHARTFWAVTLLNREQPDDEMLPGDEWKHE